MVLVWCGGGGMVSVWCVCVCDVVWCGVMSGVWCWLWYGVVWCGVVSVWSVCVCDVVWCGMIVARALACGADVWGVW